ncbi:RBBP8 N-terminal-like protein isoform X1 [Pseudonaja textilis]|uniref:RBBP8 N-terminal-like protein isoform X1 n=1 Tax=Pseudonaja textilis TaxID=8673 RepID=UPI000EA84318|nr:RBBP8 N-terminal-like protein isoform X1 [Pseudonaja textilis]
MATENFAEILIRLKETHEKEVQGLQTKLNELTNEKCRDNQRIEELFTKNHQLREQQKGLKENVKVLENRLRAGLCDRCQVTQELAKKKQHEFMKAHFQSLQHIFILTNELNKLREENKSLKEDLKRLCGPDNRDRPKTFKGQPREENFVPGVSLSILSSRSRKPSVGKNTSPETEDECPEPLEGDESPEHRLSPESRISPNILLQGDHALDMSSQKRVNQLQGTVELKRTGSRTSSQERDYPESDSPPLTSKTPPSPHCDQSPSFEAFLRANRLDCRASTSPCENLRFTTKKEQLYLFNQSLALHHLGLRNNSTNKEGDFPHHLLLAKDVGGRLKPHEEWEDRATILELPGAVLYMKDRHLENRLQLLNSSEKLRCLLMEQEGKGRSEDGSDQSWSQVPSLSPSGKKEKHSPEDSADDTLEQLFQVNRENPDQGEKATSVQDNATEAPLDLSDYGRGKESGTNWHHQSSVKHERQSPGRNENEDTVVQKTCLSSWLGTTQKHHYGNQQLESFTARTRENIAVSPVSLPREPPMSKTSSHDSTADTEVNMSFQVENQDPERPDNGNSDSIRNDSDGTVASESEMVDPHEDKALAGGSVKEDYCDVTEKTQNLQKKRKRGHDTSIKAHKKPVQGGESDAATHLLPGPKDTKETANHSPAFRPEEHKET